MSDRVEFTSSAQREYLRLPKPDRQRVGQRIELLANNPRPAGCTKLAGAKNLWRIRCGDYRVIYAIEDAALIVAVAKVGHRRDVYRGL
jgi:mRNA interferase RelE/StbE